ncbi:MAG TPA: thioredoxin domain-containing protein [Thermoanaerobaculia bacterium]|nr:thioredoxin domain-containing protein [Thermoanaerobaculia bacterium]
MSPRLLLLILLLPLSAPLAASPVAREKSLYLRDHDDNLVKWNVWGKPAFEKAKRSGKLVFLSIGYSACHWCHVMERESFMDREMAALINDRFVPILVDREEHPDVDATYLAFLEATTGSTGWPANLILTPELEPVVGTTYVKPEGLRRLLSSISDRWAANPAALSAASGKLLATAAQLSPRASSSEDLSPRSAEQLFGHLKKWYDRDHPGFGSAPKFPQPLVIDFLLRYSVQKKDGEAREMALATLRTIAASGIHDQVGGGFHRYAVDREWRVPHFEKMLFDQALLAIVFAEAWQLTNEKRFADVTRSTLDFVLRDLRDPSGGFYAAVDADSAPRIGAHHVEGSFYVWTAEELRAIAGKQASDTLGVSEEGNIPSSADPGGELKGKSVLSGESIEGALRDKLFAARERRPHPAIDDKIITGWNGLMISALARAGAALGEQRYITAAEKAARFLESHFVKSKDGRLERRYVGGAWGVEALAEDYAFLTGGLLDLYEASFDVRWLDLAVALQKRQDSLFWDEAGRRYVRGGALSGNLAGLAVENDSALPSASSASTMNLMRLAEMTDSELWRGRVRSLLRRFEPRLAASTDLPNMGSALLLALGTPKQIVIAGDRGAEDTKSLVRIVHRQFLPDRVLLVVDGPSREKLSKYLPMLRVMKPIGKRATAYVCEDYVCKMPTADPAKLTKLLE